MTRLDIKDMPGCSPLVRDYVHHFDRVSSFFAQNPHANGTYAALAKVCSEREYRRAELRDVLLAQQAAWGAPPIARRRIDELCTPQGLAVLTGQQTGLFGGPLFTLYKALTAVALAADLERALHRPVVPLFWMASEDHDVAEADHVQVLDRSGNLVQIRHTAWGEPPGGFMPANLRLGPAIQDTLARLWESLPATEFSGPLRDALAQAYAPERTLAEAFACWMTALLGETGLVLVDAADHGLKRLAAGIFRREVEEAPGTSAAILEVSRALRAQGYPTQIEARPDGVNCFLLAEGRRPLVRDPAGFRLRDTGAVIAPAALLRMVQESPEQFSPNVALRPVVQDTLFPTLAYVAGPGELTYFAQLRPVYAAFGVPMPAIVPRASLSLLDPRVVQLLDRFQRIPPGPRRRAGAARQPPPAGAAATRPGGDAGRSPAGSGRDLSAPGRGGGRGGPDATGHGGANRRARQGPPGPARKKGRAGAQATGSGHPATAPAPPGRAHAGWKAPGTRLSRPPVSREIRTDPADVAARVASMPPAGSTGW